MREGRSYLTILLINFMIVSEDFMMAFAGIFLAAASANFSLTGRYYIRVVDLSSANNDIFSSWWLDGNDRIDDSVMYFTIAALFEGIAIFLFFLLIAGYTFTLNSILSQSVKTNSLLVRWARILAFVGIGFVGFGLARFDMWFSNEFDGLADDNVVHKTRIAMYLLYVASAVCCSALPIFLFHNGGVHYRNLRNLGLGVALASVAVASIIQSQAYSTSNIRHIENDHLVDVRTDGERVIGGCSLALGLSTIGTMLIEQALLQLGFVGKDAKLAEPKTCFEPWIVRPMWTRIPDVLCHLSMASDLAAFWWFYMQSDRYQQDTDDENPSVRVVRAYWVLCMIGAGGNVLYALIVATVPPFYTLREEIFSEKPVVQEISPDSKWMTVDSGLLSSSSKDFGDDEDGRREENEEGENGFTSEGHGGVLSSLARPLIDANRPSSFDSPL